MSQTSISQPTPNYNPQNQNGQLSDTPVTDQLFPPRPGEAILATLERANTRRVPNAVLIAAAWPHMADDATSVFAVNNLKAQIYRLRKALEDHDIPMRIVVYHGGYALIHVSQTEAS